MGKAPWLKRMENGSLGEARARAFLMNRFWVLERSVDVEGADLLIQINSLKVRLLDERPPRFAVVQVKFVQDGDTTISIPVRYTEDQMGMPASEFFLLVCTGFEDEEEIYVLSSREVASSLMRKTVKGIDVYSGKAKRILHDSNLRVGSRTLSLGRIEHALQTADAVRNKSYISHLVGSPVTREQIDVDYLLPLINSYGGIPEALMEQKRAAELGRV